MARTILLLGVTLAFFLPLAWAVLMTWINSTPNKH
jgi:hypothetical protein